MADVQMTTKIRGAEGVIAYTFVKSNLLWEALQEAGSTVSSIGGRHVLNGNKRLAVLGDLVLELALAQDWYEGNEPRGRWDQIRQIGRNDHLASICRQTGLSTFINSNGASRGQVSPNTASATVEAVIGAIYLDSDLETVKIVMRTLGLVPT